MQPRRPAHSERREDRGDGRAVVGRDLRAGGDHRQPRSLDDRVDVQDGDQAHPRVDGAVKRETLVSVHDAAEVDPGVGIRDVLLLGALGDDDRERRRCDDVEVAQCACRVRVVVRRMRSPDR